MILAFTIRLYRPFPDVLNLVSPVFSSFMAILLSYSMLVDEKRLLMIVTIIGLLFFTCIGVISSPLLRRSSWGSVEHTRTMISVIFLFISPFLVACLFNVWYYWSFVNEIPVYMTSSKNALVIYTVGLCLGFLWIMKQKIHENHLNNMKLQGYLILLLVGISSFLTYRMSAEYIKL